MVSAPEGRRHAREPRRPAGGGVPPTEPAGPLDRLPPAGSRPWGLATLRDKLGRCLHGFFASVSRVGSPPRWGRLSGSGDGGQGPHGVGTRPAFPRFLRPSRHVASLHRRRTEFGSAA